MRHRWVSIASVASALLAQAPRAFAAPPTEERVHLNYTADARCGDASSFAARVDRQTSGITWTHSLSDAARGYAVTITTRAGDGGGYHGALRGTTSEGAPLAREVEGESCQEVESALAFVLAVELAPQPLSGGRDASGIEASAANEADDKTAPSDGKAAAAPPPTARGAVAVLGTPATSARWLSAVVDLGGRTGLGTTLAPLVELGAMAQIAPDDRHPWGRAHLQTSAGFAAGPPVASNGASIELSLWTVRIQGCFPRGTLRHAVLLFPCASLEGGMLVARGDSAEGGRARPRIWLAPGVSGQAVWEVSRRLYLGSELGAFAPLVRDSFYFTRRDRASFDISTWGVRLTFGATLLIL